MTYRETCEGCAKREAEVEALRAELKYAGAIERRATGQLGIFVIAWLLLLATVSAVALCWIFSGDTPEVRRSVMVCAGLAAMVCWMAVRKQ